VGCDVNPKHVEALRKAVGDAEKLKKRHDALRKYADFMVHGNGAFEIHSPHIVGHGTLRFQTANTDVTMRKVLAALLNAEADWIADQIEEIEVPT
jgi:hypothetical protein